MTFTASPERWVGLGFVATIENAPAEVLVGISSIRAVAAQIIWGLEEQKPDRMSDYLESLADHGLEPVGWGWGDADTPTGAAAEGRAHALAAVGLGLRSYIANLEEPYDAHGDTGSPKFHLPDYYVEAFREIAPTIELGVTTTPRWASNHAALREAGAVHMPQAFSLEVPSPPGPATVAACVEFSRGWGWTVDRIRPLVQVYETNGAVPAAEPYLEQSAAANVGVVPYVLEQALGGQGRELLADLTPAISRQPAPPSNGGGPPPMSTIGNQHGVTAALNRLRTLDPGGTILVPDEAGKWPALSTIASVPLDKWRAWDKLERSLTILVGDHDQGAV